MLKEPASPSVAKIEVENSAADIRELLTVMRKTYTLL